MIPSSDIPKSLVLGVALNLALWAQPSRDHRPRQTAQVTIETGRSGCHVDMDAVAAGVTDAKGTLLIVDVEPGDHYIHVSCPQEATSAYFISPHVDQKILIQPTQEHVAEVGATDPTHVAETKIELRRLVQQAIQLRNQARLEEAVSALRQAQKLDPENSDLHRELGITFLLSKEWKRARVEMMEAIRHDPTDADAHNGLGYALEKLGDLDGAVNEYRRATQLEPDDPTYRTHYLDALVKVAARLEKKK